MKSVETWTEEDRVVCKSLFGSFEFQLIGVFSHMRMSLKTILSDIGERKEVKIRAMQMNMDDVKLLNLTGF